MTATRLGAVFGLIGLGLLAPARGQTPAATAPTSISTSTGPAALGYVPSRTPAKPRPAAAATQPAKKPAKPRPVSARRVEAGPCDSDAKSICADELKKGRHALHSCLLAHRSQLSARCRAFSTPDVEVACRNEIGLLCGDAGSGSAARRACLVAHEQVATTECRNALDDAASAKQ